MVELTMTMTGISSMRSVCGWEVFGSVPSFEAKFPSCKQYSRVDFSSQTCALPLCGLSCDKRKHMNVNVDYYHHLQRRSRETEFGYTKVGTIRGLKCCPTVRASSNSLDNEAASTTSKDIPGQQPHLKSEDNPDKVEQEVGIKSGLSALDTYFSKLKAGAGSSGSLAQASKSDSAVMLASAGLHNNVVDTGNSSFGTTGKNEGKEVQGLKALDAYFEKLNPKKPVPERTQEEVQPAAKNAVELTDEELFLKSLVEAKEDYEKYPSSMEEKGSSHSGDSKYQVTAKDEDDLSTWDLDDARTTNSNLINILVATNIAVYLFGLASPHEALGITDSSLPFVYGAKVNDLMLAGQWWRFITPMFLHASLLHLGLGSWALLSFGPAIESAYGTLGFAMIYFLGGIFGDLSSFFHTPECTVGGTGPIYALVGTWVVYLLKNREVIGKEIADDMIRKVVILSAVNVALCNSLPIDDWTHLGATLIGTFFGLLASPTMQLNVPVTKTDDEDEEAYLWFHYGTSPVGLTLLFAVCLGIFVIIYQLGTSGANDFYLLQDNDLFS